MDLEELLSSIDIVDFLSQYVYLEEKNGEYWGISPLSDPPEKTPSFSVRRETGRFYCFSTGIGGTALTFLKHYYHISTREAVEILKKYAGFSDEMAAPRKKLSAVSVCKRFSAPKRIEKTFSGSILPDNCMEKYEKRADKLAVWENEGISRESLDRFQVFYDRFADRLVYPVRDVNGKIINIGARTLDPFWKEKKLRKYCYYYQFGTINTIFGLSDNMKYIREAKEIILFEGCKSVLLADTWGIRNTGAILTSHLSQNQMKILIGLGCRVVFALDNDVDVKKDRHIQKLRHFVNVEYIRDVSGLLDEKDSPVDKGKEVFEKLYDDRCRYSDSGD